MGLFSIFKKDKTPADIVTVSFRKGDMVTYRVVEGFFLYEDEVFYRPVKGSGKRLSDGATFGDVVAKSVGESIPVKEIGQREVQLLMVI